MRNVEPVHSGIKCMMEYCIIQHTNNIGCNDGRLTIGRHPHAALELEAHIKDLLSPHLHNNVASPPLHAHTLARTHCDTHMNSIFC